MATMITITIHDVTIHDFTFFRTWLLSSSVTRELEFVNVGSNVGEEVGAAVSGASRWPTDVAGVGSTEGAIVLELGGQPLSTVIFPHALPPTHLTDTEVAPLGIRVEFAHACSPMHSREQG